jgi:hypothetical protein
MRWRRRRGKVRIVRIVAIIGGAGSRSIIMFSIAPRFMLLAMALIAEVEWVIG